MDLDETSRRLGEQRAARVIAVSGQEVEWTGRQWSVDGHQCHVHSAVRSGARPQVCRFKVPSDQVLVEPDDEGASTPSFGPLVLVPPDANHRPGMGSFLSRLGSPSAVTLRKNSRNRDKGPLDDIIEGTTIVACVVTKRQVGIRLNRRGRDQRAGSRRAVRESRLVLNRIWAPWRAHYIQSASASPSLLKSVSYAGGWRAIKTGRTWSSSGARIRSSS